MIEREKVQRPELLSNEPVCESEPGAKYTIQIRCLACTVRFNVELLAVPNAVYECPMCGMPHHGGRGPA